MDSNKTPYELWTGKTIDVYHLKIFSTVLYVHIPKPKRQKLGSKAMKGYLIGYCDGKDGYRVYISCKDDAVLSRYIVFKDEKKFSFDKVSNSDVTK